MKRTSMILSIARVTVDYTALQENLNQLNYKARWQTVLMAMIPITTQKMMNLSRKSLEKMYMVIRLVKEAKNIKLYLLTIKL